MPSTYSSNLRLELIGTGEQAGTWGTTTNTNLGTLIEQAIAGYTTVTITDANYTLTTVNGASDEARSMGLNVVSSVTLTATRNVICPNVSKLYVVRNGTTGGQSIVVTTSAGTGITVPNGATAIVLCNGTDVIDPITGKLSITGGTLSGQLTLPGGGSGSQAATVSQITAAQAGAVAKAGDTMTGNLAFSGTGLRVQGDFSNATVTNRTSFQDSTTNNTTSVNALPNGTATTSGWVAFNNSNPTNAGYAALLGTNGEVQLISNATGSGTVVQLGIYVGSILRFKIQTDGAFVFYNNAGTRTASLDSSGNFIALGNVIAYGTP